MIRTKSKVFKFLLQSLTALPMVWLGSFTSAFGQGISSTIIPTDVIRLPGMDERQAMGETLKIRALESLPSKFYLNTTIEGSFRLETNPFQYPSKSSYIRRSFNGQDLSALTGSQENTVNSGFQRVNSTDQAFRILPNITAGWALTPKTRVYANYFFLRDSLFHNSIINTNVQSVGGGIQHDFTIGRKGVLTADFLTRELYQSNVHSVFDFLPSLTYTHVITPGLVAYASTILQLRGKQFFQPADREIDPFYTVGGLYQRGAWSFSTNATLVQNFRQPFNHNALIPVNSYAWILDFEIARRIFPRIPGLQAFVRAEPIFNFHSSDTPGLAGNDFRLFYGVRTIIGKPPLTAAMRDVKSEIEQQRKRHEKKIEQQERPSTSQQAPSASQQTPDANLGSNLGSASDSSPDQSIANSESPVKTQLH